MGEESLGSCVESSEKQGKLSGFFFNFICKELHKSVSQNLEEIYQWWQLGW